ncbi:MAG: hypothetical protein ACE5I1_16370 [bacterium]
MNKQSIILQKVVFVLCLTMVLFAPGCVGPAGPQGPQGPTGPPGPQGPLLSSDGLPGAVPMKIYSYFMNTSTVEDYDFGQVLLRTTGTAGEFRVCGDGAPLATWNYVVYVNGVRFTGTVVGNSCSGIFDPGAGGDFEVSIRRAKIFGVHSGDGTTNENYNIYGFSQL